MQISKTREGWSFKTRVGDMDIPNEFILVNDVTWPWEYNPHNIQPWIIYAEFGALGLVWAGTLQDALDTAVDSEQRLLSGQELSEEDAQDFIDAGGEPAYLGNASIPHDLSYVGYVELSTKDFPKELIAKMVQAVGEDDETLGDV